MKRIKTPDLTKAMSMTVAADADMRYILSLPPKEEGGATIIRGIYENFRLLGDALLVGEGIETDEYTLMIQRLLELSVSTTRPLGILDNLRKLRHDINYRGYRPAIEEIEDARDIANKLFGALKNEVLKRLKAMA